MNTRNKRKFKNDKLSSVEINNVEDDSVCSKYFKSSTEKAKKNDPSTTSSNDNSAIKGKKKNSASENSTAQTYSTDNTTNNHRRDSASQSSNDTTLHPRRLTFDNFDKPGEALAVYLLGKILVRVLLDGTKLTGRIVETEAYLGEKDAACHAFGGKRTERTAPMYKPAGTSYVYFIYGMYCCFNVSSAGEGGAVLIRALDPIQGLDIMAANRASNRKTDSSKAKALKPHHLCNGPAKLCTALNITKELNSVDMTSSSDFCLIDDQVGYDSIVLSKRIGIEGYGKEWADKKLRFYAAGNKCVSKRDKDEEFLQSS